MNKALFLILQIICTSLFWLQEASAKSIPERRIKLSTQELKKVFWENPKVYPGKIELTKRIQNYLEGRWTLTRLREFMERPEIRAFGGWGTKGFSAIDMIEGQLYTEKQDQIGKIKWSATLKNGAPERFLIERISSPYLLIELSNFRDGDFCEDAYKTYVVCESLNAALWKKFAHRSTTKFEYSCYIKKGSCRLKRDKSNNPVSITGKQHNGSSIRVGLNEKWQITSITTKGKSAPIWNSVYDNIQKVYKEQGEL